MAGRARTEQTPQRARELFLRELRQRGVLALLAGMM